MTMLGERIVRVPCGCREDLLTGIVTHHCRTHDPNVAVQVAQALDQRIRTLAETFWRIDDFLRYHGDTARYSEKVIARSYVKAELAQLLQVRRAGRDAARAA
jgi:hypothetical protein